MITPRKILLVSACVLSLTSLAAPAAVITFTHAGTGSGTLGGVPFTNQTFTITGSGDLAIGAINGGYAVDHDSASIDISGLGIFDFVSKTRTFVSNESSLVGFARAGYLGADLFTGPYSDVFASWNMQTDIATVSGQGTLLQWSLLQVITTGGILVFNSEITTTSFSATVVPEPASTVLLCCGASLLLLRRPRRG